MGVLLFYLGILVFTAGMTLLVVFLIMRNKKWSWISGFILIFGLILFITGSSVIWNESVSMAKTTKSIDQSNLTKVEKVLVAAKAQEVTEIKDLEEQNAELKQNIEEYTNTLETLQNKVNEAEDKLSTLKGEMKKAEDEPIGLGAGVGYRVGQDLPANRYEVVPNEGVKTSLLVKTYSGKVKVDTVLESDGDIPSFVLEIESMDTIEVGAPVNLIPIK
ncbi:coiled-coil domain-containing protein [Terribacillus saccharophilus]|uniref:coiled-coil domain-containing protein n=1 Tax=Terribacillus saccharophilus TaxID=361277 RepID=UPI000C9A4887|nr:DUF837 domain-containing protein [Terribacillus goriensis]